MTELSSTQEIEEFLEERLLSDLRARSRNRVWVHLARLVDKVIVVVPYPLRRAIKVVMELRTCSVRGMLGNPFFWLLTTFTSVLLGLLVLLTSLIFIDRTKTFDHVALIAAGSYFATLAVCFWCNTLRAISPGEASFVQGFCSSPERAQVVSGWIAKWGTLRASDAQFVQDNYEQYKRHFQGMLNELHLTGTVQSASVVVPWTAKVRTMVRGVFETLYGGHRFSRDKVDNILNDGELGKQLGGALLDHSTPPAQSDKPRHRI